MKKKIYKKNKFNKMATEGVEKNSKVYSLETVNFKKKNNRLNR